MPSAKSLKMPEIVPLSDLLKMKRLPRKVPLIYLTNAQWRTWKKSLPGASKIPSRLATKPSATSRSGPSVTLEVIPMPTLRGYLVQIVSTSTRLPVSMWKLRLPAGCLGIGIRRAGASRIRATCGLIFNICSTKFECGGKCSPSVITGPKGKTTEIKCLPRYRTIPETRYVASCACFPVP